MNKTNWKDIAELIGITAIVASLVFVGIQMKQSQDIAIADGFISVMFASIEINNQLNEHADIWIKGSAGEELTENESFIFNNLVFNLHEKAFFTNAQANTVGRSDPNMPTYVFASLLHRNPAAREAWNAWSNSSRPYFPFPNEPNEPLESEYFDDQVREILDKYDEL